MCAIVLYLNCCKDASTAMHVMKEENMAVNVLMHCHAVAELIISNVELNS